MADYQYITKTGLIVPNTQDILDQVKQEYIVAFGADLITTPDTPQGVLIVTEALARAAVVANNAAIANQINPNIAEGVYLDSTCALTGLKRAQATYSQVTCQLTGQPGATVPPTAVASNSNGDQFSPVTTITLDINGVGSGLFQALVAGAINVPALSITTIVNGVLGWETVTNTDPGTTGATQQSDEALRNIRNQSLGLQGVGLTTSAKAALLSGNIGVTSVAIFENKTGAPLITPDGAVTLVAHSMYYCVDGGTDTDVATILFAKKSGGCGWNGLTLVNIVDPSTGQNYPVEFDRPAYVPILVNITVSRSSNFQGDAVAVTKAAILTYTQGLLPGEAGLLIGTAVSCFELAGAVNIQSPGLFVQLCEIKKASGGSFSSATIPININERATIIAPSIVVTVI